MLDLFLLDVLFFLLVENEELDEEPDECDFDFLFLTGFFFEDFFFLGLEELELLESELDSDEKLESDLRRSVNSS